MKVRERDEDGWEGRRKGREGGEWGEDSIWQGGQTVVFEDIIIMMECDKIV